MPVARRSAPRRRVFRTRAKYDYNVTTRRYKRLLPIMWPELEWELTVLLALEQDCFTILDGLGIPEADQQYYVGYAKRLWEIAVDFGWETYAKEKTSLKNEYVLRGWDPNVLDALQDKCEEWAETKRARVLPVLERVQYPGVDLMGDNNDLNQWPGITVLANPNQIYLMFDGVDVLGGNSFMVPHSGVSVLGSTGVVVMVGMTVVVGTP